MFPKRLSTVFKHTTVHVLLCAFLVFAGTCIAASAAEYVLIAHKAVAENHLTKVDVKAIFLGNKTRWENGSSIKSVTLEDGSAHKTFLHDVIKKTPAQFTSYWNKMVFTGKSLAPKSFIDAELLVKYVASQKGAIGYVPAENTDDTVKTISIREE